MVRANKRSRFLSEAKTVRYRTVLGALVAMLLSAMAVSTAITSSAATDEPKGWLVIEGGSYPLNPVVADRFRELIGGADSKVLFIPTALDDESIQKEISAGNFDRAAKVHMGLHNYELLNTHDRQRADSEEFASRIRSARGIWFGGGRPGRLAETYLGTRTQRELESLYRNGGVIGGSSAGAMILSSFLVRGGVDNEDFSRLISQKNRVGFGFLPNAAIDVHISQRHGEADAAQIVTANPELLGIGIDAGTAIVVHGNQFEVIGGSEARVTITDGKEHDGKPYYFLKQGDRFDLARRVAMKAPEAKP
ncbi:MAG: peptidase S51 [Acidobacteria bacterium]|nr:MAG: peptidase S51 [Acidobacteriota bacterium]